MSTETKKVGFTDSSVARIKMDWERIAKETLTVECVSGAMYAHCSELAALRLGMYYAHAIVDRTAKAQYSSNLGTWYFMLEPKF